MQLTLCRCPIALLGGAEKFSVRPISSECRYLIKPINFQHPLYINRGRIKSAILFCSSIELPNVSCHVTSGLPRGEKT